MGRPPARASDRKRTSKSSCRSPFSETRPDRLPELCSSSLQVKDVSVQQEICLHVQMVVQGATCCCKGGV